MTAVPSTPDVAPEVVGGVGGGGRLWPVSVALAHRAYLGMVRIPATIIPTIVMPVFFVLAFGGAFGAITRLPGFPTDNILNWMAPFAILQGASFAGLGAAFNAGRDLENGFYDRLLLAPTRRLSLAVGPLLYSTARSLFPICTVLPVAMIGGARLVGGIAGLAALMLAAAGTALVAGLWGLGVVWRLRTQRATALVQVGLFVVLFLSVGQVPLEAMEGTWLEVVARYNPFTAVLNMARAGFLGPVDWSDVLSGLGAIAGGIVLLGWFAQRGFARFDR